MRATQPRVLGGLPQSLVFDRDGCKTEVVARENRHEEDGAQAA
ncbi:unnamed protein product [marine sediment metagenome]|uniref:Uncharacterized protein n=1 Tax=marine sediment metagenome TaxID=412755 RepID=X0WRJ7_9ZZZZ